MNQEDEQQIGSLKEFGTEFQNKCITALLNDRAFLERIVDILSPDYFETSAQKWVVEKAVKYFLEFKDVPSPLTFTVEIKKIDEQMKLLRQSIADLLTVVYGHASDSDLKYVKGQFLEFCRNRTLASAILKSVDDLKVGNYDSIKSRVDTALRAGMERNLGHDYVVDIDKRMTQIARDCIKTDWELIDQLMDGGLGKGELGFVVAPAGSGKTWLLTRFGAVAMKQGKNVLHVTLELNENYVGLRYDANFTGIAFQEIRNNVDTVKAKLANIPGKLFIKYYPLKTISAQSIKLFVDRLQMLNQINIDMLVVDYADILRPFVPDRNANSYTEAGSVYEELRAVAGELQIPVWSASQSNRGGHELDVLQASNVADSYRKIMTGDFILSLSRKMEDKQEGIGRIHVLKNRFGADGMTFPCTFDTSCGNVNVYDKQSSEGMALLQKMKDGEKSLKKMTKGLWDSMMGDDDSKP
jgi:replicative DNA helicase